MTADVLIILGLGHREIKSGISDIRTRNGTPKYVNYKSDDEDWANLIKITLYIVKYRIFLHQKSYIIKVKSFILDCTIKLESI